MDVEVEKNLPLNQYRTEAAFVMVINRYAPIETKRWLISTLQAANFQLSLISSKSDEKADRNDDLMLLVTCSDKTLESTAKCVHLDGKSLTISQQQRIILYILEKISCLERSTLVGFPSVTLYPGQSIVQICHRENVIRHYFPLHDQECLKRLKANWYRSFVSNLDDVRNYFGEKIGFYFAFLNYYSNLFFFTSIVCLLSFLFGWCFLVTELCTVAVCIGLFLFLKLWKRKTQTIAFHWNTLESYEFESARPAFKSKGMMLDPVTQTMVPFYPIQKTWFREYAISLPCVFACLYFAFRIMCLYFDIEDAVALYYREYPSLLTNILSYMPSIVYAFIVMFMNHSYRILATKLNNSENHRTQESHENHWIVKLILFEFVNNFMSLFYIAFYLRDMEMLKWNLITMLTINQLVDNLVESILPMYFLDIANALSRLKNRKNPVKSEITQVLFEKDLIEHQDSYYDYLELFIQFGYAFLFVSIWPLGPVVAYFNSLMEIRFDGMRFCNIMRRPLQRSAKSINNAWMKSFEVLSILVVVSNSLVLLIISDSIQIISAFLEISRFELVVCCEHVLLMFVLFFWYIIPDVPKEINMCLNREKYNMMKDKTIRAPLETRL